MSIVNHYSKKKNHLQSLDSEAWSDCFTIQAQWEVVCLFGDNCNSLKYCQLNSCINAFGLRILSEIVFGFAVWPYCCVSSSVTKPCLDFSYADHPLFRISLLWNQSWPSFSFLTQSFTFFQVGVKNKF